jgi:hypothetical protein
MMDDNLTSPDTDFYHRLFQYYPFTSFFTLFSAIIRNPAAPHSSSIDYPLMKGLVSYLTSMKAQNEGASKLLSIASAFTHVAGTFLKNYLKVTKQQPSAKRRREGTSETDTGPASSSFSIPGAGAPSHQPQQQPAHPPQQLPPNLPSPVGMHPQPKSDLWVCPQPLSAAAGLYPIATPPQVYVSTPSSTDTEPTDVDLQPASFLRWPTPAGQMTDTIPMQLEGDEEQDAQEHGHGQAQEGVVRGNGDGGFDVDLEALMAEPLGFQMQMAQAAAVRGPLEFDWFGWDGQFGM